MNNIAHDGENSKYISERIRSFFKTCGLSEALQKGNCYKEKGVAATAIIEYLFCLVFRNRSAYADILLGGTNLKKDTIGGLKVIPDVLPISCVTVRIGYEGKGANDNATWKT